MTKPIATQRRSGSKTHNWGKGEGPAFGVTDQDINLLAELENGLPLCERPYARIGASLKMSEDEVIERLTDMIDRGVIRRFGFVVQHRPLGYRANAMVVWNIPDDEVEAAARRIIAHDFVTLCYCRKRCEPQWPYNLYCMIHGQARAFVEKQIIVLKGAARLEPYQSQTLFSLRRFKQTGAKIHRPSSMEANTN